MHATCHPVVPESLGQHQGHHKTPRTWLSQRETKGFFCQFVIQVHDIEVSWKKNLLRAFKRLVMFEVFTEVRGCFPMAETFLLFRLTAVAMPSEFFSPAEKGKETQANSPSLTTCLARSSFHHRNPSQGAKKRHSQQIFSSTNIPILIKIEKRAKEKPCS